MADPTHNDGSWANVNWGEVLGVAAMSFSVGAVRLGHLIHRGRKWTWFDVVIEPSVSVVAGMMVWGLCEYSNTPDLLQGVLTSLGSWGGPRTIAYLDAKYLKSLGTGTDRVTRPAPLDGDQQ